MRGERDEEPDSLASIRLELDHCPSPIISGAFSFPPTAHWPVRHGLKACQAHRQPTWPKDPTDA
jgi:hypothetical protein